MCNIISVQAPKVSQMKTTSMNIPGLYPNYWQWFLGARYQNQLFQIEEPAWEVMSSYMT